MSRSSFSKAYEEIENLEPMEMTFTINDADLDKLKDVLKDINVKECPWFEVQDKHGNKAKYYREPHWIPCSERLPEDDVYVLISKKPSPISGKEFSVTIGMRYINRRSKKAEWRDSGFGYLSDDKVLAWMPLPSPYQEEGEEE